jgi:hypothetical protein
MQRLAIRNAFRKTTIVPLMVALLSAGAAHAQSVGVLTQDLKTEYNQNLQTLKQIDQYVMQGQQYAQMLTKVMNLGTNFQLLPNTMQKIDADPLVQANCNSSSSSIIGSLLNDVTSLLNQTTAKSQQSICTQIIITQVDKYNSTVDMLSTLSVDSNAVKTLESAANTFSNMGESSSATTQGTSLNNQVSAQVNDWTAHLKADDAIISSLQDMQSTLARQAMNAKPDLAGEAVQAGALTAAFTYHPSL